MAKQLKVLCKLVTVNSENRVSSRQLSKARTGKRLTRGAEKLLLMSLLAEFSQPSLSRKHVDGRLYYDG